jgi:molybdenum cofactor biosynthesis enzyme MoaA
MIQNDTMQVETVEERGTEEAALNGAAPWGELVHMPHVPCRMEYPVEENPFVSLGVDLTYRCNMSCTYCYNPIRALADMDLSYFEEVCRRLPGPIQFKFLGGEPTLHPDFMGFILAARRRKHEVTVLSNGRRYTDPAFVKALADLDARFILGISLDGGASRDDVYQQINNERCLGWKMKALDTLDKHFRGRVEISAIIVRGLNEDVITELLALADCYPKTVRYVHFRTAAKTGRWGETAPYTMEELKKLVRPHFTEEQFRPQCLWEPHCGPGEGCGACYRFRPTSRLQISLIEFATRRAAACHKRGKLVDQQFLVQSFFENIMHNSESLMEGIAGRPR